MELRAGKKFRGQIRLEIDQKTGTQDSQMLSAFARPVHLMDGCRFADRDALTSVDVEEAMSVLKISIGSAIAIAMMAATPTPSQAAPLPTNIGTIKSMLTDNITPVRWVGGWRGGWGGGWGGRGWGYRGWGRPAWGALAAGAVIGGALAAGAYYGGGDPYYGYGGGYPVYGGYGGYGGYPAYSGYGGYDCYGYGGYGGCPGYGGGYYPRPAYGYYGW